MTSRRLLVVAAVAVCCAVGLTIAAGTRHGATAVLHVPAPAIPRVAMQPCDPTVNMTNLDLTGVIRYAVGEPDGAEWTSTVTWSNGQTTTATARSSDESVTFRHPAPYTVDGTTAVHTGLRLTRAGSTQEVVAFSAGDVEPGDLVSCVHVDALADIARRMRFAHVLGADHDVHPLAQRLVACGVRTSTSAWSLDERLICATVKLTGDEDPVNPVSLEPSVADRSIPTDRFGAIELELAPRSRASVLLWRLAIVGCLAVAGAALWYRRHRRRDERADAVWRAVRREPPSAPERGP